MNEPHLYIFNCRDANNCAFTVQVITNSEQEAYTELRDNYWNDIIVDRVDFYE